MNLKIEETKREEGFTLIELLVVVIIIGILAAIAIPIFLNQRAQAWERTAQSDARNAAISLESYMNDRFEYPAAAAANTIEDGDPWELDNGEIITPSPQVTMLYDVNAAGDRFVVCAEHGNLDGGDGDGPYVAFYDSGAGGLDEDVNRNDGVAAATCVVP